MVEILDAWTDPLYEIQHEARVGGVRTMLGVPLLRNDMPIGLIALARKRIEAFTERQIALVSIFADQAVIAIENTRLLTEQQEALERQTATAEVLQVINASPGDLAPMFDAILDKAHRLCGATIGALWTFHGDFSRAVVTRGLSAEWDELLRNPAPLSAGGPSRLLMDGARLIHWPDARVIESKPSGSLASFIETSQIRTALVQTLLSNGICNKTRQ